MYRDATNLFQARFTVTLDYDFTKAFEMFDQWYAEVEEKLRTDRIKETFNQVEVSIDGIETLLAFDAIFISNRISGIKTSARYWCHKFGKYKSQHHSHGFGLFKKYFFFHNLV